MVSTLSQLKSGIKLSQRSICYIHMHGQESKIHQLKLQDFSHSRHFNKVTRSSSVFPNHSIFIYLQLRLLSRQKPAHILCQGLQKERQMSQNKTHPPISNINKATHWGNLWNHSSAKPRTKNLVLTIIWTFRIISMTSKLLLLAENHLKI